MTTFKVGELITGRSDIHVPYCYTTERSLCIVEDVRDNETIVVTIVAHANNDYCNHANVEAKYFTHCTYEKFMEKYPNAGLTSHYSAEELNKIKNDESGEKEMELGLRMDKEKYGTYELTDEERKTLRTEIMDLLADYDYNPTKKAVDKILDEWVKNKGWLINLFKQHPNYNGKFQIAFDTDYQRNVNKDLIYEFHCFLNEAARNMVIPEKKIGVFSFSEAKSAQYRAENVLYHIKELISYNAQIPLSLKIEAERESHKWNGIYGKYVDAHRRGEIEVSDGKAYDKEALCKKKDLRYFASLINGTYDHIATEEFANKVNEYYPKTKAVAGQKVSRIVNKVCKFLGIDKNEDYNREFAKYSDAINPLSIKRHTVLSIHPIDYLTMSFGNSWASCHTIDKHNKRKMPDNYHGCYSSGTLSYMLDESSFVFYTVDKDYDGNELELQDKINRNMFHIGKDKLIQGRVYPQTTDGEGGIYRQIREVTQKVIADCIETPNMWKNVKGTRECADVVRSYGTHYRDYTNYSDCNVSYLKTEGTDDVNRGAIIIGHTPICPHCGEEHSWEESIECDGCYNGEKTCYSCGDSYDEDNMHYIDGEWYCEDCCFWCEYHGEWEIGDESEDSYYVDNYNYGSRVCNEALENSGKFIYCEHCGSWYYIGNCDYIETEDGRTYCDSNCAYNAGYRELDDGNWYPEEEVYYCEHCDKDIHKDNWNDELQCCIDCEDEVKANMEEEAV